MATAVPASDARRIPNRRLLRPSARLVIVAVLAGGAPGLIPLVAAFHGSTPLYGIVGAFWLTAHMGCGLCAFYAPWRLVRVGEPIALVIAVTALAIPFIPDSMVVLFPGIVLWIVVAAEGFDAGGDTLADRLLDQLRRTYG